MHHIIRPQTVSKRGLALDSIAANNHSTTCNANSNLGIWLQIAPSWKNRHLSYTRAYMNDDDDGRINISVALSPKTTRKRNKKPKQWSHVIVVSAMRRS